MRRVIIIIALMSAMFALTAQAALADNPSFHYANASVSSSTGALSVDFKLTGLGTATTADVSLTADASATYQCWNNGGHHPKAGNKTTVNGPLLSNGTFPVRNGQVTATITAGPLSQGSFSCPSGQSLYLEDVSYSNITISTTEGGGASTLTTPSSVSLTGLHIFIQ
jgi:hypothetical protein